MKRGSISLKVWGKKWSQNRYSLVLFATPCCRELDKSLFGGNLQGRNLENKTKWICLFPKKFVYCEHVQWFRSPSGVYSSRFLETHIEKDNYHRQHKGQYHGDGKLYAPINMYYLLFAFSKLVVWHTYCWFGRQFVKLWNNSVHK